MIHGSTLCCFSGVGYKCKPHLHYSCIVLLNFEIYVSFSLFLQQIDNFAGVAYKIPACDCKRTIYENIVIIWKFFHVNKCYKEIFYLRCYFYFYYLNSKITTSTNVLSYLKSVSLFASWIFRHQTPYLVSVWAPSWLHFVLVYCISFAVFLIKDFPQYDQ